MSTRRRFSACKIINYVSRLDLKKILVLIYTARRLHFFNYLIINRFFMNGWDDREDASEFFFLMFRQGMSERLRAASFFQCSVNQWARFGESVCRPAKEKKDKVRSVKLSQAVAKLIGRSGFSRPVFPGPVTALKLRGSAFRSVLSSFRSIISRRRQSIIMSHVAVSERKYLNYLYERQTEKIFYYICFKTRDSHLSCHLHKFRYYDEPKILPLELISSVLKSSLNSVPFSCSLLPHFVQDFFKNFPVRTVLSGYIPGYLKKKLSFSLGDCSEFELYSDQNNFNKYNSYEYDCDGHVIRITLGVERCDTLFF